jgi:hypothetical protein
MTPSTRGEISVSPAEGREFPLYSLGTLKPQDWLSGNRLEGEEIRAPISVVDMPPSRRAAGGRERLRRWVRAAAQIINEFAGLQIAPRPQTLRRGRSRLQGENVR